MSTTQLARQWKIPAMLAGATAFAIIMAAPLVTSANAPRVLDGFTPFREHLKITTEDTVAQRVAPMSATATQ